MRKFAMPKEWGVRRHDSVPKLTAERAESAYQALFGRFPYLPRPVDQNGNSRSDEALYQIIIRNYSGNDQMPRYQLHDEIDEIDALYWHEFVPNVGSGELRPLDYNVESDKNVDTQAPEPGKVDQNETIGEAAARFADRYQLDYGRYQKMISQSQANRGELAERYLGDNSYVWDTRTGTVNFTREQNREFEAYWNEFLTGTMPAANGNVRFISTAKAQRRTEPPPTNVTREWTSYVNYKRSRNVNINLVMTIRWINATKRQTVEDPETGQRRDLLPFPTQDSLQYELGYYAILPGMLDPRSPESRTRAHMRMESRDHADSENYRPGNPIFEIDNAINLTAKLQAVLGSPKPNQRHPDPVFISAYDVANWLHLGDIRKYPTLASAEPVAERLLANTPTITEAPGGTDEPKKDFTKLIRKRQP